MFQLRRSSGCIIILLGNRRSENSRGQECLVEQRLETVNLVEFWGLPPLIPPLQCVNRLGFEICSVN